jgi:site-specific DNA-methyltransferase (adenine-specific)/adenine-specific DNA-methyltransferase
MNLNERDKQIIKDYIDNNKPIPSPYRNKLFASDDVDYVEATKDYKLVYKGKARKEDIIANTPAAPLQKIRSFNSENPFADG